MTQLKDNQILLLRNYLSTDLLLRVPEDERDFEKLHVIQSEEQNDYFYYFNTGNNTLFGAFSLVFSS